MKSNTKRERESIYANEKGRKWGRSSMSREQKRERRKAELIEMRTKFNKPNKFDDGSDFLAG